MPDPYVLILHEVEDYAAWKAVFDAAAGLRKAAGELSFQVLRQDDDAHQIVHVSRWRSLAHARLFFESPALVEIRRRAGVRAPQFLYLEQLDHGDL
ncbi:MAG: antibiotic biosynthesis monooxygenase [Phenylobacterium sp.]|uniref:antibiotic biosynthesis monooxygenase n=1 Tax=Phenylobacterium sp. TaxID=1871053 RepID=UPI003BB4EF02